MIQGRGIALVVDDEESVRTVLQRALELAGYDVLTAASGQEALDALVLRNAEVMLLDLGMPGLSGQEVLQRVKAEHPDVAVIVVTAMAGVQVAVEHLHGLVALMIQAVVQRDPQRHPERPQSKDDRTARFTRWSEYWMIFDIPTQPGFQP